MASLNNKEPAKGTEQVPPIVGPSENDTVASGSSLTTVNGVAPSGNTSCTATGSSSSTTGTIKKRREERKKDEKRSKRDQRSWDKLFKSLSGLPDSEKLEVMKDKYNDLYNEYKTVATINKTMEKQLKHMKLEKDTAELDLVKSILSKSKLENLARELQKQNKDIKEANHNRLKEEEEKRREVSASFTEKLNTLTQLMDESKTKSIRLRDENLDMTSKLTELYEQFQERENHLTNMNRQMELEKQLSDTQLQKKEFEFETKQEIWKKEKAMLIADLERSEESNKILQDNVNSLRDNLNSYQKQYSDFEVTMKKSNMVFEAFKDEMSSMHRANSVLEKDRNEWHNQWRIATQKCLTLSESKTKLNEELQLKQKKLDALEKLCRKLSLDRSHYLQQIRALNITPVDDEAVSLPTLPNPLAAPEAPLQQDNSPSLTEKVAMASSTSFGSEGVCCPRFITFRNPLAVQAANAFKEELKILTQKVKETSIEVESDTTSSIIPCSSSDHSDVPIDYTSGITPGTSSGNSSENPSVEPSDPKYYLTPTKVTKTDESETSRNE